MTESNSRDDFKAVSLLNIVKGDLPALSCIHSALVVGCGSGQEAGVLAQVFDCQVTAIDVDDNFRCADPRVHFMRMDARSMQFGDSSFDLVYSFHALEHISDPVRAVKEIARVLTDGGGYCIGTPNRFRMVGYVGSADTSWRQKIQWNIHDWIARLLGRFRNDLGAHAGFTASELLYLCKTIGAGQDISDRYYYSIYSRYAAAFAPICLLRLQNIFWPSVYVFGHKSAASLDRFQLGKQH